MTIDWAKALRAELVSKPLLTSLVGSRIYAEADYPAEGYTPAVGPAICFKASGGTIDASNALLVPRVQFKCYAANEVQCQQTSWRLFDALHFQHGAAVRWATQQTVPVTLREPESGWLFVLVYYNVWVALA